MMNQRISLVRLSYGMVVTVFASLMVATAQQSLEGKSHCTETLKSIIAKLQSDRAAERAVALEQLRRERLVAISEIIHFVSDETNTKTGIPDTPVHLGIILLGEWNATGAQHLLLKMIDYRISLTSGAKYPPGYEYPAAFALTKMSGENFASEVTTLLAAESSPVRSRLFVWVLYRLFGIAGATEAVDSASKSASGVELERLRKAREQISMGNQLVSGLQADVQQR